MLLLHAKKQIYCAVLIHLCDSWSIFRPFDSLLLLISHSSGHLLTSVSQLCEDPTFTLLLLHSLEFRVRFCIYTMGLDALKCV